MSAGLSSAKGDYAAQNLTDSDLSEAITAADLPDLRACPDLALEKW